MVLTDGKGNGNVLAVDEEGNTIVEAADCSFVMMDFGGNIIAAGDAEGYVVLTDGEDNVIAVEGAQHHHITEATDGSARCLALMATSSRLGTPRFILCWRVVKPAQW